MVNSSNEKIRRKVEKVVDGREKERERYGKRGRENAKRRGWQRGMRGGMPDTLHFSIMLRVQLYYYGNVCDTNKFRSSFPFLTLQPRKRRCR